MPDSLQPSMALPAVHHPAIYLDYGVDGVCGEESACEVCERGMRIHAPWQFEIGTLLNVAFCLEGAQMIRIEAEAYVIECTRQKPRCYCTTLAFIEPPPELKANLGKVTARLVGRPG